MHLVREVNMYPDGINLDWAIQYVNKVSRPVEISRNELERQLRALSHEVVICGNNLYPAKRTGATSQRPSATTYIPPPRLRASSQSSSNDSYSRPNPPAEVMTETAPSAQMLIRFTGEDDDADDADDIPPKYPSPTSEPPRRNGYRDQETSRQNCESHNSYKETKQDYYGKQDPYRVQDSYRDQNSHRSQDSYREEGSHGKQDSYRETSNYARDSRNMGNSLRDKYDDTNHSQDKNHYEESRRLAEAVYNREDCGEDNDIVNDDNILDQDYIEDRSALINQRIRARLANLIQNHPDGIWCADLPQKYLEEFRIPLNYLELGFNSVCEFASQLPSIFHCVRPTNAGDYKVFNAKLPVPNLRNEEPQTRETLASKYSLYDDGEDDPEVFPGRLDPSTTKKLYPEGVMELKETVGHISVTVLGKEHDFEEVEVSEVFTPSFFWIQLRRKLPKFRKLMYELEAYYENNKSKYQIPLIMLEKGLNVACVYAQKWHRGLIKTVLPDGRSTVHFYDYGTVKSYLPDELYFLHRRFSYLPAQAIPCGLFNVRPYETDKWSKTITWEFVKRTSVPLIATIGARNEEENSLLVSLTDTRGDEDFHINDWMYLKKYAQQGRMVRIMNRNFAFSHYRECLERKGYDPNAIHEFYDDYDDSDLSDSNDYNNANAKNSVNRLSRENKNSESAHKNPFFPVSRKDQSINKNNRSLQSPDPSEILGQNDENCLKTRSRNAHHQSTRIEYKFLKSDRFVDVKHAESGTVEIKTAVPEVVETKPLESQPVPGRLLALKRTQTLLAKYAEKDNSNSSGYKKTSESPKTASSKSVSSAGSESKIERLRRFMLKSQTSTDKVEKRDCPAPIRKIVVDLSAPHSQPETCNLGSKDDESLPNPKPDSPLTTESDSDSIPVHSPLLLKENPEEEKKKVTFFGNITSECGGSGRMEPINWTAIRTALEECEGQFATIKNKYTRCADLSTKISKRDGLSLVDSSTVFIVDNDINSAQYERDVKWLPAGNVKHSRTSVSPLLKLKQRLLANSYKKQASLISSKMVSILKGELQDVYEDEEPEISLNIDKLSDLEKPSDVEKPAEVENAEKVSRPCEAKTIEEVEKPSEIEKTADVEKAEEPKSADEAEEEEKRREEQDQKKVQLYIEAQKLRSFQDPYSSLVHLTENEAKPEFKNAELSSLMKGFVAKQLEFNAKMAALAAELPPEPEVKTKRKKRKSKKRRRSKSSTPDLSPSSSGSVQELVELVEIGESKSLENEEPKLSTLDDVSSILSNDLAEESCKLDSTILTNGSLEEKNLSNLLDEKDQVPDLIDVEEEFVKQVDSSLDLNNDFKNEKESILNVVDSLSVKAPKPIIIERLMNLKSPSGSIESLDSDDLSSSDDEEGTDLIKECKTILIPGCTESSKQDNDQISEAKTENPVANLELSKEKTLSQALPESKDLKVDKDLVYEEILLNPDPKQNGKNLCVFNDVDITSDDDEQWDVMSYLSDQSHLADPCNRLAKNYRKTYNQMIKDNPLQIEEIPNNEINTKDKSNGIVPPNFKLPKSTKNSLISTSSTLGLMKNAVNGNKQEFINFKYSEDMKSRKGKNAETESLTAEPEVHLKPDSPTPKYEDFLLDSNENSTSVFKNYEPPGKSKSLKNMLLQMKKK
ncbi:uncharacterized protein LOC117179433 isoform X2 [Belonocnema kinseyi]|uniref:uncharacterized protein LOC117179433 isoform X2 n=1 Tax=Belonocnema kinseyi TaxID=2817044 RepID=UPI00143DBC5E|nr:uncharacterized protein LOC117179433 isoform X2 [Belonocnema kinseyi]